MTRVWTASGPLAVENPCGSLEHFAQRLAKKEQGREEMLLALETIRDCVRAEVVFCYPGRSGEPFRCVGSPALSICWVGAFLGQVGRSDRMVEQFLDPRAKPLRPWPISAVLVRLRPGENGWLGGLSFHPRRRFGMVDLEQVALVRHLLIQHWENRRLVETWQESMHGLARCLTAAIGMKDPRTRRHSERVGRLARRLGEQMGLPAACLADLYLAGLLHDIGYLGMGEERLPEVGAFTEERDQKQQHARIGEQILAELGPLEHLCPAVRHHHERWDGKGYPDGLAGEQIPLLARILAVADGYEKMRVAASSHLALSPERIDGLLTQGAGSCWDPDLIAIYMTCREDLHALCEAGCLEEEIGGGQREGPQATSSRKGRDPGLACWLEGGMREQQARKEEGE